MNREVSKQEILKATLHSIHLGGIRATKVDSIAASLGISKRTLYELYPSKQDLIQVCIQKTEEEWEEKINRLETSFKGDALLRIWEFIRLYTENLYNIQIIFWTELVKDERLNNWCMATKKKWIQQCSSLVQACQKEGYILKNINVTLFSERILTGIFQSRVENYPFEKQYVFSYIMIRGASTQAGIRYLNKIIAQSDGKKKEYLLLCK